MLNPIKNERFSCHYQNTLVTPRGHFPTWLIPVGQKNQIGAIPSLSRFLKNRAQSINTGLFAPPASVSFFPFSFLSAPIVSRSSTASTSPSLACTSSTCWNNLFDAATSPSCANPQPNAQVLRPHGTQKRYSATRGSLSGGTASRPDSTVRLDV
jgi:hypothetical protein